VVFVAEYSLSAEITPTLAKGFTSSVKSQMSKALAGVDASVKIKANLDTAAAKTDLRKFITASRSDIKFTGRFDDNGLSAKVKAAAEKASANVTLGVDLDDKAVAARLRELERSRSATISVDADTSAAESSISRLQALAAGVFLAIGAGGAVLPSLLAGVAGGLGAVGGSAVGVAKALKAYTQEQDKTVQSSAQSASSALSSAIAIRNAQEGVDAARRNSANVAENSARQISDAQQGIVDAERGVVSAERDLGSAQAEALRAQLAINEARQQAARDLEDLQNKVSDYALTQEDAQIGLLRAQENLTKVNADYRSSELDKREAVLQVAQAQDRLKDAAAQQIRDTQDLNKAQAAGVDGSAQVVSAKDAEKSANERVLSAQEKVTTSQEALQKAQTNLARTQVDAARSQENAAIQVAQALQAVTDAQDRSAAAGQKATTTVDKFAAAMAKLSPAAQDFVKQVLAMGDEWTRFQKATQTATLPGFTELLRSLSSIEGPATQGIAAIGREISNIGFHASDLLKNPIFQGRLQQSFENAVPIVGAFGDGVLKVTDRMVQFAAENSNISQSTAKLLTSLFGGINDFYNNLQPNVQGVSRLLEGLGVLTQDIAGGLGTLFGQFAGAYSQNASAFEQTFHELLDTFLNLTGAALPALSNGLSILATALRLVNTIVQPFVSFLGGLGGYVAAGVVALKLLSKTAGGVAGAFSAINPTDVGKRLDGSDLGKKIGTIGQAAEGGATSTGKFSSAIGKAGQGALSAAKYLPLVGVAIGAGAAALDSFAPKLDDLAGKYLQGGKAADDVRSKTYQLSDGWKNGAAAGFFFRDSMDDVRQKASELYAQMSLLERRQTDVTAAQNNLTEATNKFGPQSREAQTASQLYAFAQRDLRDAQWAAEQATKTHTDKIRDQQQAMLDQANGVVSYNAAMLRVQTAQQQVTEATKQYGAGSIQARQAQNDLEQAMLGSVTAAGQLATAQTQGLAPSQQTAYQTDAINRQLAILSQQAGTTLPPALQQMVQGLSNTDLAAFGATVRVDGLGNRIVTLPDGKTLTFPTNADDAKRRVDDLAGAVKNLNTVWDNYIRSYLDFLNAPAIQNPPPGAPVLPLMNKASGGFISGPGSGTSDSIPAMLSNGEFVVKAAAVRHTLPLLNAINNGFAKGGLVGFADGGAVTTPTATPAAAGAVTIDPAALGALGATADAVTVSIAALALELAANLSPQLSALVANLNTAAIPALIALMDQNNALAGNEQYLSGVVAASWAAISATIVAQSNASVGQQLTMQNVFGSSWAAISNSAWASVNSQQNAFNTLNAGLAGVRGAIQFTADWAQQQFQRVWDAASGPIRAVLIGPINGGIIGAWNSLNAQFALNRPVAPVGIPFATGGYVSGPGGPTTDSINARLSNGEYVVPAAVTKKVRPFLDALRVGQGEAMEAAGYRPGYATGGLVANTGSQLNANIARGLSWLNQQAGKPYVWGAVGPSAYDCSGLMSALTNTLRGEQNPYRRLGVAASQPWGGFVPGLSSAFATGFNSHHTAGTLNGINAEARQSGVPVLVGPSASGADSSQFTGTASLPLVGGQFIPGGGSFDPTAIVAAALQDALGQADGIAGQWPGNIAAQAGAGMVHRAVEAIIPAGAGILNSVLATTASAGSPEVTAAVRAVAAKYGWGDGAEWAALSNLIQGESSWDPNAANRTTSARGLFQKMTNLHGPLEPTVAGQAEWGLSYIRNTYGDPIGAYGKWQSRSPHWYDQGGYLPKGPGLYSIAKGTSKPEAVLDPASTAAYVQHANALSGDGKVRLDDYTIHRLAWELAEANSTRPLTVNNPGLNIGVAGV
jgi:hypothetical protein